MTTIARTAEPSRIRRVTTTRLLIGGAAAPPVFATAVLVQAATRDGYAITRHPASVLANGNLGWVQITTFLVTGALMLGCAIGVKRVLQEGPGHVWGPRLLALQGVGLIIAGLFRMDAADGFPTGTPDGVPSTMSWHAVVHNLAGTVSFVAMIVLCSVLARRFTGAWARVGRLCAVLFAAGLVWAFSGGTAGALTLFLGVITAWSWISVTAARLVRTA